MLLLFGCFFQYKALKIVFNSTESFEDLSLHSNGVSFSSKTVKSIDY